MTINYSEIFKLSSLLLDKKIPFEMLKVNFANGYQILYPNRLNRVCSVILHSGSYGHEEGLLEIMGLLTDEESEWDSVVGYLSAVEVFERINKHYNENK